MNLQRALKSWSDERFYAECLHLLGKKDGDADWKPYMREAVARIMERQEPKRPVGRPSSAKALNLAEIEHRLTIQSQQLEGAKKLNGYLLNQIRTAKGVK